MTEILERWRPQMIAIFSPAGLKAIEEIKAFIRESVDSVALEEAALELAGLPDDAIFAGLAEYSEELAKGFVAAGLSEKFRAGFTIASADMIRERVIALQSHGSGHA
jgi:hypothetical protein